MMVRLLLLSFALLLTSCFDTLPDKQCDASRRCTADDEAVCGSDGRWYECGLMADCESVAVVFDESTCGEQPDNNLNNLQRCPQIDPTCQREEVVDGCSVCVDCAPVPCPLDCAQVCLADGSAQCQCEEPPECGPVPCMAEWCRVECGPDGEGVCICDDPPECAPIDPACGTDPQCTISIDEFGCQTCDCPPDRCSRDFCDLYCPNGYLIENGCPTCQCHEPCSEGPECDLACPTGNATDPATGCLDSCSCIADECAPVVCTLFCENGFRRDGTGCEVCECRGTPCLSHEECGVDEVCVQETGVFDEVPEGECVALDPCVDGECDHGHCGFYYRQDCCPPLTTCNDNLAACPDLCLLEMGDL